MPVGTLKPELRQTPTLTLYSLVDSIQQHRHDCQPFRRKYIHFARYSSIHVIASNIFDISFWLDAAFGDLHVDISIGRRLIRHSHPVET